MKTEIMETSKGNLSMCHLEEHEIIRSTSDFLDVISNCPTDTVVLNKDRLHEDFFELRTRLAGECLQKITNYRMRLVILGSFDNIESRSLRDFIYESNKNGKTVFAEEINSAIDLLR